MWKRIKSFFRENDYFAISFTFRYKKEDKFSTWQGGIITFIIIAIYLFFGIYYFIPFIRKKNFTIFYNTINLKGTSSIKIKMDSSEIKIGLECGIQQEEELNKYLNFSVIYYTKKTNDSGTFPIGKVDIYSVDETSKIYEINGTYGDDTFQYIEISLNSKNNTSDYINKIDRFLFENDCKLEFHYTDYSIDYNKFEEPFNKFNNEIFLQLNPYFCVKMNVFFMEQILANDNDLLFEYKDEEIKRTIFSRSEQYFLYKGNNNTKEENRPKDYESYGKIYLRADSKKVEIKRKYQTFFEFWADTFSFWNALIAVIAFILNSFYKFYAFHFIGNEIFFFKEKKSNNLNFSEKNKEIKRLMDITKVKESKSILKYNLTNIEKNNENINQTLNNLREGDKNENNNSQKIIKYSFNFYEIPLVIKWLKIFRCIQICKYQKLINKINLYSKAKNIMKEKLNIVVYIKNMLYLDTFKKRIKNEDKDYILEFLGMPITSPVQSEINEENSNINNNIFLKSSLGKFGTDNLKLSNIKKEEN